MHTSLFQIYDGETETTPQRLITAFTGKKDTNSFLNLFYSNGNTMIVDFTSDGNLTEKGFTAELYQQPRRNFNFNLIFNF